MINKTFLIIIFYRIIISCNLATVFDPDEFWQSLESNKFKNLFYDCF